MKRILMSVVATVGGLVALLSFKTSQPVTQSGALPSAGLPGAAPSSAAPSSAAPSGSPTASPTTAPTGKSTASRSATNTAKTYLGSAITTEYGVVQVKVTVSGKRITNVAFQQLTAFDGRSQEINSAAAPQLLDETLAAQSAHIDTVSGASYTTAGYEQSLQSALDAAGVG
jgi:uncharacterized protein with FMN-binding domain